MEQRLAFGRPHAWQMQLMNVPFLQTLDAEANTESVLRNGGRLNPTSRIRAYGNCNVLEIKAGMSKVCTTPGLGSRLVWR